MNKRIAIIDSGIGGTSLLAELIGKQVGVEIFYQADSKFVPYGEKTQTFMIERMKLMIHSLPKVDSIVIA